MSNASRVVGIASMVQLRWSLLGGTGMTVHQARVMALAAVLVGIAGRMTSDQIAEAQRRAPKWTPTPEP